MSDLIVAHARPRVDFSSPCFHREAVALQHRYATIGRSLTKRTLRSALKTIPGHLDWIESPLTDGYMPYGIVYFKTKRAKIAIVFPQCFDDSGEDGTETDRSLTIHFIGDVVVDHMVSLTNSLLFVLAQQPLRNR